MHGIRALLYILTIIFPYCRDADPENRRMVAVDPGMAGKVKENHFPTRLVSEPVNPYEDVEWNKIRFPKRTGHS